MSICLLSSLLADSSRGTIIYNCLETRTNILCIIYISYFGMNPMDDKKNKGFSSVGDVLSRFKTDEDKYIGHEFQKYGYELANHAA